MQPSKAESQPDMTSSGTYKILLVDDDPRVLEMLIEIFSDHYETIGASSGAQAVDFARQNSEIGAVVMDIKMAGMDGITAARLIKQIRPELPIIFHTGYPGDYEESQLDASERPFDYIEKGNSISRLLRSAHNAMEAYCLKKDVRRLHEHAELTHGIIGRSASMVEVFRLIHKVSPCDTKVMILGDTGTGKELVARAIHRGSPRRDRRLAIFNCNHKSADLVESELFGHIKGSFTGAIADRVGLFEYADGGTLFLDEIGDLDITTQAKLLRVLETGEYSRVGAPDVRTCDIRLICATHKDLEQMIQEHRFRDDLYYRLKGVQIKLPSLRDRREDIPLLIGRFTDRLTIERDLPPKFFEPEAMTLLIGFDWPGNVRQLEDAIETLIVMSDSDLIVAEDVRKCLGLAKAESTEGARGLTIKLKCYRRTLIVEALNETGGNISAAARLLEVDKANLRKWIIEHNIPMG
jgi:DNA-binding NtrC family response regulator